MAVDGYLPCALVKSEAQKRKRSTATVNAVNVPSSSLLPTGSKSKAGASEVVPLYSKPLNSTLWCAVLEKAYAKHHKCYASLSGGFVWEAFYDVLGAPVEVLVNAAYAGGPEKRDEMWVKLLSYVSSRFVLGASCMITNKEEGLIGFHAYSLLDVREIKNVRQGAQTKIDQHFTSDAEVQVVGVKRNGENADGTRDLRSEHLSGEAKRYFHS